MNDLIKRQLETIATQHVRVAFVSGNFNILHPGHLRFLNFAAECGDFLVVAVHPDGAEGVMVPQNIRLEGVQSVGAVDFAFVLDGTPEEAISILRPAVVVKGKEYENAHNPEQAIVESNGGRLLFSSGEVRFSSFDLLQKELFDRAPGISKPRDFPERHGFRLEDLVDTVSRFAGLNVVVVGDLIVDEYINCEPLGMSREDPTIVVSPIRSDRFVGGAGIVASHAAGLGARVHYLGVCGEDEVARFAADHLERAGVQCQLVADGSRPTSLKQRYRAHNKTLLRVSQLRQHDISARIADRLYAHLHEQLPDADLLIFSDFNYGCLPQEFVERASALCRELGVRMVADSQSSSQVGDVSRFRDMLILTPTEYEARLAVRDQHVGLVVLAERLRTQARAQEILLTLGPEGVLIHAPDETGVPVTDRLPAFNTSPKDVSGAGDAMLTCVALARVAGADIWRSAYLGSVAAACQVGRVGNSPITAGELIAELTE